jgi:hypothetical protein
VFVYGQQSAQAGSTAAAPSGGKADDTGAAPADPFSNRGNPMQFGSVMVYPSITVKYGYDDNITQSPDSANKANSSYEQYKAEIAADYETRGDKYGLTYTADIFRYNNSTRDDIENNTLSLNGANNFTARNALNWRLGYTDGFEPRGSTDVTGPDPNHYEDALASATYRYGAQDAKGRIEVDVSRNGRKYLNNRDITAKLDKDTDAYGARFYVRVMPKTQFLIEARQSDTEYRNPAAGGLEKDLDSKETSYRLGVTWDATAKTRGTFKIGQTQRDYQVRQDFKGTTWDLNVNWSPKTYSKVDLTANRSVSDTTVSNLGTNYLLLTSYGVKWQHAWLERFRTDLGFTYLDTEYDGDVRRDKQRTVSAGLHYDFRRWMSIGTEFSYAKRDSTVDANDFNRRQAMAVVRLRY